MRVPIHYSPTFRWFLTGEKLTENEYLFPDLPHRPDIPNDELC